MINIKNIGTVFIHVLLLSATSIGCKKSEDVRTSTPKPEKDIALFFGANNSVNRPKTIHLYSDTVYLLNNGFSREAGEELIIDKGTLIKGDATFPHDIIILPGAKITVNGSATSPVIFTSADLQGNQRKNWGRIIIQGKSINNDQGAIGDTTDNSGILSYLRIEFGSLDLQSVGNQTLLENIQVSYASGNSSFSFEGGTVNGRNLLSYACDGAADFYLTKGYRGRLQSIVAQRHPYFGDNTGMPNGSLAALFIENNSSNPNASPRTLPTISNLTAIGPDLQNGTKAIYKDTNNRSGALITTNNALFLIRNSVFMGYPRSGWWLDDRATGQSLIDGKSEMKNSFFYSPDTTHPFYLPVTTYPPFTSNDFKDFVLTPAYNNQLFFSTEQFHLKDPFNYERPDLLPNSGSQLLAGANFEGPGFDNVFFEKLNYSGAFSTMDWTLPWANYTPLKTDYNFPK